MAKPAATQSVLVEINALKDQLASLNTQLVASLARQEEMIRAVSTSIVELNETNAKILAQKSSGSSGAKARKTPTLSYVDDDGKMKTVTEWFKYIWVNDNENTRKTFMKDSHMKALAAHMNEPKLKVLPAERKLREQVQFIWNTFVKSGGEKSDKALREHIAAAYAKVKAEVEKSKKAETVVVSTGAKTADEDDDAGEEVEEGGDEADDD